MSTGIVAVLGNNSSITYTASSETKLVIAASSDVLTGDIHVKINGIKALSVGVGVIVADVYVSAGVPVKIETEANSNCIVSALES